MYMDMRITEQQHMFACAELLAYTSSLNKNLLFYSDYSIFFSIKIIMSTAESIKSLENVFCTNSKCKYSPIFCDLKCKLQP